MKFSTAWLTTNRTCNNHCTWCYAKNTLDSKNIMGIDETKLMVDALAERNVKNIILIGGEPTIYPHLVELVEYIHKKGLRVSMATNGRRFADLEFAGKVLSAGIDGIDISLKGISEKEYFFNTLSYGLEEMIKGYNNLKSLHFNPSMSYVLVNDDEEYFDKLISFIEENNISPFSFQFVKPIIGGETSDAEFDLKKMGKFVEVIYNKLSKTSINYCIEVSFPLCLINQDILSRLSKEDRIINCCHVPRGSGINFDENFRIIPCNHFAEFPFSETPVNVYEDSSIEEIMETEIVKNFRKKARCYPASKCKTCNLWEQCGGGCFTNWLSLNPNDYIE